MRLGELSIAGKIFIFLLICGIGYGVYSWYTSRKFYAQIEKGDVSLNSGNYSAAITYYKSALDIKSSSEAKAEVNKLINNASSMKETEITKLKQEIIAVVGDKYGGVEGANTVAIRKGYYSAVEIESIQKKIDRLKSIYSDETVLGQFQRTLDKQKYQVKGRQ